MNTQPEKFCIALGADHAGYNYKEVIKTYLTTAGYDVKDCGAYSSDSVDYPDFAAAAAESVSQKHSVRAILVCGSGIGVSITANKVNGIRAANCTSPTMAELSRRHNNANVVTIGARLMSEEEALDIVRVFLETEFEGGRHERRVAKIHSLTGC